MILTDINVIKILVPGPRGPRGAVWRGAWNSLTNYKAYDLVRLDPAGNTYLSLRNNIGAQPDISPLDWDLFMPNTGIGSVPPGTMIYTGAWSALATYATGQIVLFGGALYMALQASLNQQPPNPTYWAPVSGNMGSMIWRGDYSPTATYVKNDIVRYNSALFTVYVNDPVTGALPTDTSKWQLVLTENFGGNQGGWTWRDPVGSVNQLPLVDNVISDARMVAVGLSGSPEPWVWDGTQWVRSTATGATGGGGGPIIRMPFISSTGGSYAQFSIGGTSAYFAASDPVPEAGNYIVQLRGIVRARSGSVQKAQMVGGNNTVRIYNIDGTPGAVIYNAGEVIGEDDNTPLDYSIGDPIIIDSSPIAMAAGDYLTSSGLTTDWTVIGLKIVTGIFLNVMLAGASLRLVKV